MKALSDDQLFALVEQKIGKFPILKKIYDKNTLDTIIKKRSNYDNYLLWLLASEETYALETWKEISKSLELLKDCNSIGHFKEKLKSTSKITLNNYLLELEFASFYKEKGFAIELEPKISTNGKNPDFKVITSDYDIFFEAKNLSDEEIKSLNNFNKQLMGVLGRVKEKLVFSINRDIDISVGEIPKIKRFVLQKLRENENLDSFPVKYYFPNGKQKKVELVIEGRPNGLQFGYLKMIGSSEAFEISNREKILGKIASKVSQLPKDGHNVIVVQRSDLFTNENRIMDALFGAETRFYSDRRIGDRVFSSNKNTRISAVIYFERQWVEEHFVKQKRVYHNPYANNPIPIEFFKDANVKQFAITDKTSTYMTMSWL